MPTNTPYDPTLVLGNIISQDQPDGVQRTAAQQAPADADGGRRQALEAMLRSLDATAQELDNMGIDASDIRRKREEIAALLR